MCSIFCWFARRVSSCHVPRVCVVVSFFFAFFLSSSNISILYIFSLPPIFMHNIRVKKSNLNRKQHTESSPRAPREKKKKLLYFLSPSIVSPLNDPETRKHTKTRSSASDIKKKTQSHRAPRIFNSQLGFSLLLPNAQAAAEQASKFRQHTTDSESARVLV